MVMKLVYGIVLLAGISSVVVAFTVPPRPAVRVTTMVLSESAAEEYLAGCLDKWDQVEKELVNLKAEADLSGNEIANQIAAANLAEKMLMKALETARATRDVEMEHAFEAHSTMDQAMEEQVEGKEHLQQLDNDVIGAVQQAGMVEGMDASYEDTERLRDLSIAHAAHDEGMDWMAKVMDAQNVAAKAKEEFIGAEMKQQQLQQSEAELKAALKELHDAKNTLLMKQWEQQKQKEAE